MDIKIGYIFKDISEKSYTHNKLFKVVFVSENWYHITFNSGKGTHISRGIEHKALLKDFVFCPVETLLYGEI